MERVEGYTVIVEDADTGEQYEAGETDVRGRASVEVPEGLYGYGITDDNGISSNSLLLSTNPEEAWRDDGIRVEEYTAVLVEVDVLISP